MLIMLIIAGGAVARRADRSSEMTLLGKTLLILVGIAVVGLPLATVLLWSHVRGPRVVRGGTRLSLLLAGQVATVLLVALLANDYGEFYTSWGDLWGTPPGHASVTTYGTTAATPSDGHAQPVPPPLRGPASGHLQVLGPTDWSSRSQWHTRGMVESVTIAGLGSRLKATGYVYLPPQYFAAADAHHLFPAVEVLTGYPGSALNLVSRLNYPAAAQQSVQQHHSAPMIYVLLSSTVAPPRDTECTDVPGGPQAETFLATEVPNAVSTALRVQPARWGIIGDSTGGYCATKITMAYRDTFAAGVSLSGYYFARSDATTGSLWGGSTALKHANDPEWLLAHRPAPPVSLYITISHQAKAFDGYPDTMKFLHLVRPPMNVTAVVEPHGGHSFSAWAAELPDALHWLSDRLSA